MYVMKVQKMNKHIKESLKLNANQLSPMTENSANLWKTLFTLPLHTQKCSLTHESHSTQSTTYLLYKICGPEHSQTAPLSHSRHIQSHIKLLRNHGRLLLVSFT